MLGLFSVGGGALRGAGDGWGTGDYLSATDDTDLDAAAGCFATFGVVVVFSVPTVGLRPVDFADGIRGTFRAIFLPAGLDDVLVTADHAVIHVSQVAGVTGGLVLSFTGFLPLGTAYGTVAGAGAAEEGGPAGVAGSGAQGGGFGGGKAVITLRLLSAICGEHLAAGDASFRSHGGCLADGEVNDFAGGFVVLGELPALYFVTVDRPQLHLLRVFGV